MRLTVAERISYTYNEYGAILLCGLGLSFTRGQIRVLLQQLLGVNECHLLGQHWRYVRKLLVNSALYLTHYIVNFRYRGLQIVEIAVGCGNSLLPVPLVNIK